MHDTAGTRVRIESTGGGGWGDPPGHEPERVGRGRGPFSPREVDYRLLSDRDHADGDSLNAGGTP